MADQNEEVPAPDYDDEQLAQQKAKHVHSTEEKDAILHINAADEVIELNNLRIFTMDEIDLSQLTRCTLLEMRKNLLHKLIPLPRELRDRLETLDLFDNKIRNIGPYFSHCDSLAFTSSKLPLIRPDLLAANNGNGCAFACLKKLDLSYNQIATITGLDDLAGTLEELYLVENRIKKVEGLSKLTRLRLLELGGNQIRDVSTGLETLVNLEQLWLGKNKIDTIGTGLVTLSRLKRLSLQANRLTRIEEVTFPAGAHPDLDELYVSENGLSTIANIGNLHSLTILDYSFNPITTLYARHETAAPSVGSDEPAAPTPKKVSELTAANFPALEEFWLTDGKIDSWEEIEEVLKPFAATLRTVYLERNPIERDKRYRNRVYMALPFVTQIDSWPVVNKADPEADRATRR
jgi:protein phosphatase 1 regulatory subunit 7